jgi:hypothetical protein
VESYIAKNPDDDSNNLRRNNILRTYYNDKRMEFKKDPVQFVIDNNDEVKDELNRVFLKLHSFVIVISSKYVVSS